MICLPFDCRECAEVVLLAQPIRDSTNICMNYAINIRPSPSTQYKLMSSLSIPTRYDFHEVCACVQTPYLLRDRPGTTQEIPRIICLASRINFLSILLCTLKQLYTRIAPRHACVVIESIVMILPILGLTLVRSIDASACNVDSVSENVLTFCKINSTHICVSIDCASACACVKVLRH